MTTLQRVGIVGYGEVGRIFARGLAALGVKVWVWDIAFKDPDRRPAMVTQAGADGIACAAGLPELTAQVSAGGGPGLVISAVTASNTLAVAREAAGHWFPSTWFLDLNSASPGTKQQAASLVDAAGGHYVEAGVMTSVPPHGLRVPMLLGGATAAELAEHLSAWGMDVQVADARIGVASATKMCRSIMIKGLEALVLESYAAARHYGVEDAMLATLEETFPGIDWTRQGAYFFSRVAQHGQRRAEEMREAAQTVREAGFEPTMAAAIADKHEWMARQARAGHFARLSPNSPWQDYADALLAARDSDTPAR